MRAGGATSLAEHRVPPSIIQPLGHWSSQAFLIYIRQSPTLIQAMLYSDRHIQCVAHQRQSFFPPFLDVRPLFVFLMSSCPTFNSLSLQPVITFIVSHFFSLLLSRSAHPLKKKKFSFSSTSRKST